MDEKYPTAPPPAYTDLSTAGGAQPGSYPPPGPSSYPPPGASTYGPTGDQSWQNNYNTQFGTASYNPAQGTVHPTVTVAAPATTTNSGYPSTVQYVPTAVPMRHHGQCTPKVILFMCIPFIIFVVITAIMMGVFFSQRP